MPQCFSWPNCFCGENLSHWQNRALTVWQDANIPKKELDIAEEILFLTFQCMKENCRDPKWRRKAREELEHPVFGRQYRVAYESAVEFDRKKQ